jgi:hypothetical protein
MSIIDSAFLRLLYNDCQNQPDYKVLRFWMGYLCQEFPQLSYCVSGGYALVGSSSRIDLGVERFNPEHGSLNHLLYMAMERPDQGLDRVEEKVLDAAGDCFEERDITRLYILTASGTSFRLWAVDKDVKQLTPLHGTDIRGDKSQYVDADSSESLLLPNLISQIKGSFLLVFQLLVLQTF